MKINVLFLLLFSLAAQSLRAQATPPIIPLPGSYQEVTGSFLLDSKTTVYIVGMQANLWTEVIATPARFEFMTFPRITALSEAAWGQNNDYDDYLERLKLQIPLYEKEDLYFFNPFNVSQTPEPKR